MGQTSSTQIFIILWNSITWIYQSLNQSYRYPITYKAKFISVKQNNIITFEGNGTRYMANIQILLGAASQKLEFASTTSNSPRNPLIKRRFFKRSLRTNALAITALLCWIVWSSQQFEFEWEMRLRRSELGKADCETILLENYYALSWKNALF